MITKFANNKVLIEKQFIKDIEISSGYVYWNNFHPFGWQKLSESISFFKSLCKQEGFTFGYSEINSTGVRIRQIKEKWGNFVVYSETIDEESEKKLKDTYYKVLKKIPGLEKYFDVMDYDVKEYKQFNSMEEYEEWKTNKSNTKEFIYYEKDKEFILIEEKEFKSKYDLLGGNISNVLPNGDTIKISNILINDVAIKGFSKFGGEFKFETNNIIIKRNKIEKNKLDKYEMSFLQHSLEEVNVEILNIKNLKIYKKRTLDEFLIIIKNKKENIRINLILSYF